MRFISVTDDFHVDNLLAIDHRSGLHDGSTRCFATRCRGCGGSNGRCGQRQPALNVEKAEDDNRRAGKLQKVSLNSAARKTRNSRERHQCRQRSERERQHGQRSDRHAALGEHIKLQRLRKAAGKKKGRCAEDESAALCLLLAEFVNSVRKEFRHSRL